MTTIHIARDHDLTPDDRAEALEDLASYLKEIGAKVQQGPDDLTFSGRGFEGRVAVEPGKAVGQIKLGMLARPFRHQLESEINRHLDARLGVR